jgi:cathepsin L
VRADSSNIRPLKLKESVNAPDEYDWRSEKGGKVRGVKDQGVCGASWAFAAISAQSSIFAIDNNDVPRDLSEQNLIDCVTSNRGCESGSFIDAWNYVIAAQDGNFISTYTYPYTGTDGKCKYNEGTVDTFMHGIGAPAHPTENSLLETVYEYGPMACMVDGSGIKFQMYGGGVYDNRECSSTCLNHAMLVVGWGRDSASFKEYWIVQNSWGISWGEKGYIKMVRNHNNQCGIASACAAPTIRD